MIARQLPTEKITFLQYRSSAKQRNLFFDISFQEFATIIRQECFYCGEPSSRLLRFYNQSNKKWEVVGRNGVDRIDNDIGYVLENCVPCCGICNTMKRTMTIEEFFRQISRIYHLRIKSVSKE